MINGNPFRQEKGDPFILPLSSWHEHGNRWDKEEAILF
jgi:gentisate 1,2-dioxygenase